MAIPTRQQAVAIILELHASPRLLRHVCAVADVAAFLAARTAARGRPVDRRLVETAALLHDVDKLFPPRDPRRAGGHGAAGATWLTEQGWAELAGPVAGHPVGRLLDHEGDAAAWLAAAPLETLIVAYADKRAAQRLEPMAARFARWRRDHPDRDGSLGRAWAIAVELEHQVCGAAGVTPPTVGRLRWVGRATARARR
ncbi:MAG TPA: HD domain-containing protein [Candidatus Limnocylindrales bacterium]